MEQNNVTFGGPLPTSTWIELVKVVRRLARLASIEGSVMCTLDSPTSSEQDLPYRQFRSKVLETVWLHLLHGPQEPEHDIRRVHGIYGNHHHMAYGVEEEYHL